MVLRSAAVDSSANVAADGTSEGLMLPFIELGVSRSIYFSSPRDCSVNVEAGGKDRMCGSRFARNLHIADLDPTRV